MKDYSKFCCEREEKARGSTLREEDPLLFFALPLFVLQDDFKSLSLCFSSKGYVARGLRENSRVWLRERSADQHVLRILNSFRDNGYMS